MLSGKLWPAHPHPLPGEALSSWIVRLAHCNGLKVQTFCFLVFGTRYEIWTRDIDRSAPDWLIALLGRKTATSLKRVRATTLRFYQGKVFPELHPGSQLPWVMPLKHHHRITTHYAWQYCPSCLLEDAEPYYRLKWRLAFYTFCPKHQVYLYDRCYRCNSPVAFHRIEQGKPDVFEVESLAYCWKCKADLSKADQIGYLVGEEGSSAEARRCRFLQAFDKQFVNCGRYRLYRLAMMHNVCRLLCSRSKAPQLHRYICEKSGLPFRHIERNGVPVEKRTLDERHYLCLLAWWIIDRYMKEVKRAIKCRVIKTHQLKLKNSIKDH